MRDNAPPRSIDKDLEEYGDDFPDIIFKLYNEGAYDHDEKYREYAKNAVVKLRKRKDFFNGIKQFTDTIAGCGLLAAFVSFGYQVWHWLYHGYWVSVSLYSLFDFMRWDYSSIIYPSSWYGVANFVSWWMSVNLAIHLIIYGFIISLIVTIAATKIYNAITGHAFPQERY